MATHSCILAWRIPWAKEAGGFTVHGNYTEKKKGEKEKQNFLFLVLMTRESFKEE